MHPLVKLESTAKGTLGLCEFVSRANRVNTDALCVLCDKSVVLNFKYKQTSFLHALLINMGGWCGPGRQQHTCFGFEK